MWRLVLALEPEELAGELLFLLRSRPDGQMFHPANLKSELDHSAWAKLTSDRRRQWPRAS